MASTPCGMPAPTPSWRISPQRTTSWRSSWAAGATSMPGTMTAPVSVQPTTEATLPPPPVGFAVRPATLEDLTPVIEFLRLCDTPDWGSPDFTAAELLYLCRLPDPQLAR